MFVIFNIISGKEFKSFRPSIQVDSCLGNRIKKETINKKNEFLKHKVEEPHKEKSMHSKKKTKHVKCQVITMLIV